MRNKKFVLDTSIIIDGEITKMLEAGSIEEESDIIIPLAVLDDSSRRHLPIKSTALWGWKR